MDISQTTIEAKTKFTLPENAEVLKKETRIRVEEIENGYLLRKSYEIKWKDESGETRWDNFDKAWLGFFHNPLRRSHPWNLRSIFH